MLSYSFPAVKFRSTVVSGFLRRARDGGQDLSQVLSFCLQKRDPEMAEMAKIFTVDLCICNTFMLTWLPGLACEGENPGQQCEESSGGD